MKYVVDTKSPIEVAPKLMQYARLICAEVNVKTLIDLENGFGFTYDWWKDCITGVYKLKEVNL